MESHKGSVNAEVLADFIRGSLVAQMQSLNVESTTSVVLMDNCSIHDTELVMDLLKEAGIVVIFLSPYSPYYNPIELVFVYTKAYLKHHDELLQALSGPLPDWISNASPGLCINYVILHGSFKLHLGV